MELWLLAILPPQIISKEILNIQKEIEEKYAAIHAQKAPPHITVIPPFKCEEKKLNSFIKGLSNFLVQSNMQKTRIHLDSFQHFESRTIFVDVAKNEKLLGLCKAIKLTFNSYKLIKQRVEKHYFVPHITIANKDLKKRDFKTAWQEFKSRSYQQAFDLETISLLRFNNGKWTVSKTFNLQ